MHIRKREDAIAPSLLYFYQILHVKTSSFLKCKIPLSTIIILSAIPAFVQHHID